MRRVLTILILLLTQANAVVAHEVHHVVEAAEAVAVRLAYADGKPFAFEAYEAYPEGREMPAQVGRTDDQGRALFVPGEVKRWRVRAFSADGHGVDLKIDTPDTAVSRTGNADVTGGQPNRASLLLFGVSALLGIFGAYQLWLRKKK